MLYVPLSVVASGLISGLDLSVPFQAPPPPFPTCAAANKEIGTEVVLGFIFKQICILRIAKQLVFKRNNFDLQGDNLHFIVIA